MVPDTDHHLCLEATQKHGPTSKIFSRFVKGLKTGHVSVLMYSDKVIFIYRALQLKQGMSLAVIG